MMPWRQLRFFRNTEQSESNLLRRVNLKLLPILLVLAAVVSCVSVSGGGIPAGRFAVRGASAELTPQDSLRIRRALLRRINQDRKRHGLKLLKLDLLTSRVADQHCSEMIRKNYMSHWNVNGLKPYHRYALAGGQYHIAENLYSSSVWGTVYRCTASDILDYALTGERSFMSEKPPNDGHRKNILEWYHTHVGIGFACSSHEFRMAEEFVDRYIVLDNLPQKIRRGYRQTISGKILKSGLYPVMAVVDYEPIPKRKSPRELRKLGSYLDGSRHKSFRTISAWEMNFYPISRRFYFTLDFSGARRGYYYMIIYLSRKVDQSLYKNSKAQKAAGTFYLSTKHAIPATGVVFILN